MPIILLSTLFKTYQPLTFPPSTMESAQAQASTAYFASQRHCHPKTPDHTHLSRRHFPRRTTVPRRTFIATHRSQAPLTLRPTSHKSRHARPHLTHPTPRTKRQSTHGSSPSPGNRHKRPPQRQIRRSEHGTSITPPAPRCRPCRPRAAASPTTAPRFLRQRLGACNRAMHQHQPKRR